MAFCSISKELSATAHTEIENIFLFEYMPDLSGDTVKVYLYGLYLGSSSPKNYCLKDMATALKYTEDQVKEHFRVLEDAGLVSVNEAGDFEVCYLPVTATPKKFKPEKYTDFTLALQSILPDRMVSVAECRAYFTLMESYNLKPDALLLIIRYCVDKKGTSTNYKYVLAKAKDFAERGLLTADAVENELSDYFKNSDAIDAILKKLGLKRKAELSDLKFYEKWINDLGFPPESILIAAAKTKYGDLKKLDSVLLELCGAKAFTKKEIDDFFARREELALLSREICRNLSVYVEVIDPVVSDYVAPWTSLGYDRAALLALAKYCFKRGKRTLAALDELISRLYERGVVSLTSILSYVEESKRVESVLTQMLRAAGVDRKVTPWDKENYTVWKDKWNFSDEMILYVAGLSAGKSNPIPYLNAVLSALKAEGVYTVEEAKAKRPPLPPTKTAQAATNFTQRTYSEEELDRIFAGSDTELL